MLSIFEFDDYRDYLLYVYKYRKKENSLYSYRMMGDRFGVDSSQLHRILQKRENLPSRCLPIVKEDLDLNDNTSECFDLLFAISQTKNTEKRQKLYVKTQSLHEVQRRDIKNKELEFLSHWWIAVIRSYLEVNSGKSDASKIAKQLQPAISTSDAKKAILLLKDLGMVKRLPSERLQISDVHLTVSGVEKSKAVRKFQKQVMNLAIDSIDEIDVEQRDVSTLTMAMDDECFDEIREMARNFRRQVQKRVEKSNYPTRVYQLNTSFFPVTEKFTKDFLKDV